jgi:hypothetical protein
VEDVLAKVGWLRSWLSRDAPALNALPSEYVWLASGPVHLGSGTRQWRTLAAKGVRLVGRHLRID